MSRHWRLALSIAACIGIPSECSSHPTGRSSQEHSDRIHVVVRAYATDVLPIEDWYAALAMASQVLSDAAVDVGWVTCGRIEPPSSPCNAPVAANELSLRVIDIHTPRRSLGKLPLGYSLIDMGLRRGTLATIYFDRVAWLAAAGHADPVTLAARAIAHEIGHLLRGGNEHSTSGLMRAVWDREELQHERRQDWRFTDADARAMHAAFTARPQGRNVEPAIERTVDGTVEGTVAWGTR